MIEGIENSEFIYSIKEENVELNGKFKFLIHFRIKKKFYKKNI